MILQSKQTVIEHSVLLILTARLGKKSVTQSNFDMLLDVMSLPVFAGGLGGAPGRARYLTGRNGTQISYLDPHHVDE